MKIKAVDHPFYPRDLQLPHYVPNDKGTMELLGVFAGSLAVCIIGLWVVMGSRRHLDGRIACKLKITWFFMCGLIHLILEGYFAVFYRTIPQDSTFLDQCWKEYGKGDSRYMSGDSFTVCMEGITAFVDGPLAFLATYAFLSNKPYRYVVQLMLSLFQIYGDTLYYATAVKEGYRHGPLWHPLYFWFYFVFLNALWILVPFVCIVESYVNLSSAQSVLDKKESSTDGHLKKKK